MIEVAVRDASSFRAAARALAAADVTPADVLWRDDAAPLPLPGLAGATVPAGGATLKVPRRFVALVERAACHRDGERWAVAYRVLHRLTHGEPHLLSLPADLDVRRLERLAQAVDHEAHKMKAFVRFRRIAAPQDIGDGGEIYVAWYAPAHPVLSRVEAFFVERFASMRWSILTPDGCAHWDGAMLSHTPGVSRAAAPTEDELEPLWLAYYGAIFNPSRLNLDAMQRHMPLRFWSTMPESAIVRELVQAAPQRSLDMRRGDRSAARLFLPVLDGSAADKLATLRAALPGCRACGLCERATQPVFGEGPADAELVLVGEQPGDEEDRRNRPFVGAAGRLLDQLLSEAGIDRARVYVTNAVKAFKFEARDKLRIHQRPSAREVAACHGWVDAEVRAIAPKKIVCLGASAAQSFLGPRFRMTRSRGQLFATPWAPRWTATWHPAAILRMDAAAAPVARAELVADLRRAISDGG